MARKLTVYTGKGVGVFDLSVRPDMYTEPQAATIVMHDQEDHERVFTESEVRAILRDAGLLDQIGHSVDKGIYSQRRVNAVFGAAGIFLDPA